MPTPATALSAAAAAEVLVPWARALLARHAALFDPASASTGQGVLPAELQRWVRGEPTSAERIARARACDVEINSARARAAAWSLTPAGDRWRRLTADLAVGEVELDLLALLVTIDLSPRVAATARLLSNWPDAPGLERAFVQSVLDPMETRGEIVASVLRPNHPLADRAVIRGLQDGGGSHLQFLDGHPLVLSWLAQGPEAACRGLDHVRWHDIDAPDDVLWHWGTVATDIAAVAETLGRGVTRVRLRSSLAEDALLVARGVAHELGRGLVAVDGRGAVQRSAGETMAMDGQALGDLVRAAALLATVEGAMLYIGGIGIDDAARNVDLQPVLHACRTLAVPILLEDAAPADAPSTVAQLSRELAATPVTLTFPERLARLDLWTRVLGAAVAQLDDATLQQLATFPLTTTQIATTAENAQRESATIDAAALAEACRERIGHRVGDVAQRVTTGAKWDDVVLPEKTMDVVREIIAFARHGEKVLVSWGFAARYHYGLGLTSLFSGPPGTGKTMLAGMIARELGLDLFRIDLSRVMSKYIGETEQRLGRLFEEGRRGGVALLFDEADSLFARRTEVRTSVDRYANLEVNFLLQKMEEYTGVVFLTTNLADSIDDAFKRRIRFHVQFPIPGAEERERLWESMVPPDMPVEDDLPFDLLARAYEFTGGEIKNAVLRAAFYAAAEDTILTLEVLDRAAQAECQERGRLVLRTASSFL